MASLFHPLCGGTPPTLWQLFTDAGGIAPQRLPQAALALALALARWPFSRWEGRLTAQVLDAPMPPPIFIVGYWRSGTTHLHNLLSQSPAFGYITPLATGLPWDILGLVGTLEPWLEKALPRDRYVDQVAVTPTAPQEDAIPLATMGAASYYHGLYFPQRFRHHFNRGVFFAGDDGTAVAQWQDCQRLLLHKVSIQQQGKPLLVKNPVYTAQVARLCQLWPGAKFIHIYRNPYVVFPSSRHFFLRLLPELALQTYDPATLTTEVEDLILTSYPPMMAALEADRTTLPAHDFAEIRFEALEQDPLSTLEQLYTTLDLGDFAPVRPALATYLEGLQGYRKNRYDLAPELLDRVEAHWGSWIRRWGYERPGA
ncbi:MAG TPA: sulfotransferase [Leptolyngbyaceae cyanobacterium M65_K2018_010]|nr:sulfotransferase [Leptolyngbyaceae cyanobacterium M65_K2018_010]